MISRAARSDQRAAQYRGLLSQKLISSLSVTHISHNEESFRASRHLDRSMRRFAIYSCLDAQATYHSCSVLQQRKVYFSISTDGHVLIISEE